MIPMEIEIQSKKNNPLLNRMEVRFLVNHDKEGTPRRESIRQGLAEKLNVSKDTIFVDHMRSAYGIQRTEGYAKVYSSAENVKTSERTYILARHGLAEKKKTKEAGAKKPKPEGKPRAAEKPGKEPAAPPKPAEKPAEKHAEKKE